MQNKPSIRVRLAKALLGSRSKEFVQPLSPLDGWSLNGSGRLNQYSNKPDQLSANVGWCFTANTAIVDPAAAVKFKLFRVKKDGDREEITQHEILDLLNAPNLIHTGEQMRQLHYTYMNFCGESYIYMIKGGDHFIPAKGQLPDALQIMPSHQVVFKLGATYSKSIVRFNHNEYPSAAFIRDLNPDPGNPYFGRSIIAASAPIIDTENQMKEWNRRLFANMARPSLVFNTEQPLSDAQYKRWKQQFVDEDTGTENAFKPLLIEGGKATPYMMNATDLDFLNSRKFSMQEILSMWHVSPSILGQVENVNRANMDAGFYMHAVNNTVPRVRQFTNQLNNTLVKIYDPTLELDFENPVPEDVEAKLQAATDGVDKWWTKDEVRDMYGEKPLPDGLGEHIIVAGKGGSRTLEAVVEGAPEEAAPTSAPEDQDNPDDDEDEPKPSKDAKKSLLGVKKKT